MSHKGRYVCVHVSLHLCVCVRAPVRDFIVCFCLCAGQGAGSQGAGLGAASQALPMSMAGLPGG